MKAHPVIGETLLRKSGGDADLLDVVRHHHEKMNGMGYPDGLKGQAISLLSRMAAVCDVYDAITSNRPYKEGWNPPPRCTRWQAGKGTSIAKSSTHL